MSVDKHASMDKKEELYLLLLDQIRESRTQDISNSYPKKDSLILSKSAKGLVTGYNSENLKVILENNK